MKKVLKPKRKMLSVMFTAWGMIFIENDVLMYFRAHSICSGVQKKNTIFEGMYFEKFVHTRNEARTHFSVSELLNPSV